MPPNKYFQNTKPERTEFVWLKKRRKREQEPPDTCRPFQEDGSAVFPSYGENKEIAGNCREDLTLVLDP